MDSPVCPICGGNTSKASLHFPLSYWRCRECRSAHLFPQPTSDQLNKYYDRFHLPSDQGGLFEEFEGRTAKDFPVKAELVSQYLRSVEKKRMEMLRILDVGCGKGFFVRELRKYGHEVEGIDLSTSAVLAGRQTFGIEGLRQGGIEDQQDWVGRFDAVTAWATIEHLPSPRSFLASIRSVLKPGGFLFIDTGLADDFTERWVPGLTQWYDPPQHLHVISKTGLEILLTQSGFKIIHFDVGFERNHVRRLVKDVRNRLLAIIGCALFRTALGKGAYGRMRMETKMPFGSLALIVARRKDVL